MFSWPLPLLHQEPRLIDPGPTVPEDDEVMNQIANNARELSFCFDVRFPEGGRQLAHDSMELFKLLRCLRFALTMYMHGKARAAGKEYDHVLEQSFRVWDLLQKKFDPVENAGQVSQLDDVL